MYHDAYTLQVVEPPNLAAFNNAAGMVPFLLNHILDVSFPYATTSLGEVNFAYCKSYQM